MMQKISIKKQFGELWASKKALAIPVTYLILFFSLIIIVSLTYSLAVARISAKGSSLKTSVAKQNMLILDDAVYSVAWSFGASKVVYMEDCGCLFQTQVTAKNLLLNLTDETSFFSIIFNSPLGKAFYRLEASEYSFANPFIKGDNRVIVNASGSGMAQLFVETGEESRELAVCYRPSATVAVVGTSNGKPLNLIRVYVLNLNSSQNLQLRESFYLKVTAVNVTTITYQYDFNQSLSHLSLKAVFDGKSGVVKLPVESNAQGASVNLELVICNIKLQKAEV